MVKHDWDKIGRAQFRILSLDFGGKSKKIGGFFNPGTLTFRMYDAGKCSIVDNIALQMLAPSLKIELALILYWSAPV